MTQRSTREGRRAKQDASAELAKQTSGGLQATAHRVDAPRNQGGRWLSGSPIAARISPVRDVAKTTVRLDRLVQPTNQSSAAAADKLHHHETSFERSVKDVLANPRWSRQLGSFSQMLQEAARYEPLVVSFVSLADELDGSRVVMATALLQSQAGIDVLVVDGDRHRRTLSILLQQNHAAGLWDAIPAGTPIGSLAIQLASPKVWFVPAGTRTLAEGGMNLWHGLHDNAGRYRLVLINAGVWPSPDLASVMSASDRVYAVVRCGATRRKHYREFCQRLEQTGKNLAGCIVSGTFE